MNAYQGLRWLRPLKSSRLSASKPARDSSMIMPKAPMTHQHVDHDVEHATRRSR